MNLLKLNRVGTLTAYKELDVFEDPEAAYKQYLLEQADPKTSLEEVDKQVFDREANEDLYIVIGGAEPDEREDISDEYVNYLNEWLLTDKYKLLQQKNPKAAARVSQFIDGIVAKADRKAAKLAMQPDPMAGQMTPEMMALSQQQPGQQGQPPQAPQSPSPDSGPPSGLPSANGIINS